MTITTNTTAPLTTDEYVERYRHLNDEVLRLLSELAVRSRLSLRASLGIEERSDEDSLLGTVLANAVSAGELGFLEPDLYYIDHGKRRLAVTHDPEDVRIAEAAKAMLALCWHYDRELGSTNKGWRWYSNIAGMMGLERDYAPLADLLATDEHVEVSAESEMFQAHVLSFRVRPRKRR